MSLSRLENFLRATRGTTLHVNPEDLNSTDSITNEGSSPFTPFKTLNRALLEAARYSYRIGNQNDVFNFCTIKLYSGEHFVDNRPGAIIDDDGNATLKNGSSVSLSEFDLLTDLEITSSSNRLYLLNSVNGGLIIPRGTSIIGEDLRKTVIRPLYVPDPENNSIDASAIFRMTGACLFNGFTILDANPGGFCYKNYTTSKFTPNFSHHKLTGFEFVDGVNFVEDTTRTDLQQYYEKISIVYGGTSGREIEDASYVDGVSVDIQPIIDEYRIVGPRGEQVGISSIISGDGITPSEEITVTLDETISAIDVDTSIQISGVDSPGYDGQFVVSEVPASNQVKYITPNIPTVAAPTTFGATLNIISDTVQSSSPYVFDVSLKSVYGMCGLHADGSVVEGFKSVVVAQFTAISLQKDDNAFTLYDETSGTYTYSPSVVNLYRNSRAKYKPSYHNYHIKVSNDAFAQLVSVFSIGYASQFVAESGGDYSITNSNSSFGSKAFISSGYRNNSFDQDDYGYIVGFIPPEEIQEDEVKIEFSKIDVGLTTSVSAGAASTTKLYLYDETDENSIPEFYIEGYKVGAKSGDTLNIISPVVASSSIVIPNTTLSSEKTFIVQRENNNTENSISSGVITLTSSHSFETGEKVRVISENGHLPDGIENKIYYVITTGLSSDEIKLASTYINAINNIAISPNKKGGKLSIVSRVSDKVPNDPGHPIQWDSTNNNWYITVNSSNNGIYSAIKDLQVTTTGRTYFTRTPDKRINENKIYKLLYSIPKETNTAARPPVNGYIIQESNDTTLDGAEFNRYFGSTDLSSENELRNPKFIVSASWSTNKVTVTTELPHNLNVGSTVEIVNVTPSGYNGTYTVTEVPTSRTFTYALTTNPGTFTNNTTTRNANLPYIRRKDLNNIFKIYKVNPLQEYIQNSQDGLYELCVINSSNSPTVSPFTDLKLSQPIENLYPDLDRDNPNSNPTSSICFAEPNNIGNVVVNDTKNSITKETFDKVSNSFNIGFGITAIVSNTAGTAHTIYTSTDHGLSAIRSFSVVSSGSSYVPGTYYGVGVSTTRPGVSAAFKVEVGITSSITSVELMYGGSGYSIGDRVLVNSGIKTSSGFVPAVLNISAVNSNVNDCITITGIQGDNSSYNNTYRITGVPSPKQVTLSPTSTISTYSTVPVNVSSSAIFVGKAVPVSTLTYNNVSGIATVTFSDYHGIQVNSKVRFTGFTSSFYNADVLVTSINSSTQIEVDFGVNSIIPPTTGTNIFGIPLTVTSSAEPRRTKYYYAGISTVTSAAIQATDPDGTALSILNATSTGLVKGDFIEVNGEVMRIKSQITSDSVVVYRAKFGTDRKTHPTNSVIRKVKILPVELRRNSIIRASGHTFEYVGYGPGNYSTALPENQDRELTFTDKKLAHSTKYSGGTVYYSGMDENGDFYSGTRKSSSITGETRSYDVPIPSLYNESTNDYLLTEKGLFSDSIKVSGDNLSEFYGPVAFGKKVSVDDEIRVKSITLSGDNNISVASTSPTTIGNFGDVELNTSPKQGENIGWVFTEENTWREFGPIKNQDGMYVGIWTGTFYGDFAGNITVPQLWVSNSVGIHTLAKVAIGRTVSSSIYELFVDGDAAFTGNVGIDSSLSIDGDLNLNGTLNVADATIPIAKLTNSTISGVSLGSTLSPLTFGNYLTSSGSYNGSSSVTVSVSATSITTPNTVVARNSSGGFSAGVITCTTIQSQISNSNNFQINGTSIVNSSRNLENISLGSTTITTLRSGITTTVTNKTLVNREHCEVLVDNLTITLPANPSPGWEVSVGVGSFENTTLARNGNNIMSLTDNLVIDRQNINLVFTYINNTIGWRIN